MSVVVSSVRESFTFQHRGQSEAARDSHMPEQKPERPAWPLSVSCVCVRSIWTSRGELRVSLRVFAVWGTQRQGLGAWGVGYMVHLRVNCDIRFVSLYHSKLSYN